MDEDKQHINKRLDDLFKRIDKIMEENPFLVSDMNEETGDLSEKLTGEGIGDMLKVCDNCQNIFEERDMVNELDKTEGKYLCYDCFKEFVKSKSDKNIKIGIMDKIKFYLSKLIFRV